jgi:hypothetical protein
MMMSWYFGTVGIGLVGAGLYCRSRDQNVLAALLMALALGTLLTSLSMALPYLSAL